MDQKRSTWFWCMDACRDRCDSETKFEFIISFSLPKINGKAYVSTLRTTASLLISLHYKHSLIIPNYYKYVAYYSIVHGGAAWCKV